MQLAFDWLSSRSAGAVILWASTLPVADMAPPSRTLVLQPDVLLPYPPDRAPEPTRDQLARLQGSLIPWRPPSQEPHQYPALDEPRAGGWAMPPWIHANANHSSNLLIQILTNPILLSNIWHQMPTPNALPGRHQSRTLGDAFITLCSISQRVYDAVMIGLGGLQNTAFYVPGLRCQCRIYSDIPHQLDHGFGELCLKRVHQAPPIQMLKFCPRLGSPYRTWLGFGVFRHDNGPYCSECMDWKRHNNDYSLERWWGAQRVQRLPDNRVY